MPSIKLMMLSPCYVYYIFSQSKADSSAYCSFHATTDEALLWCCRVISSMVIMKRAHTLSPMKYELTFHLIIIYFRR